jgi:hypothetical protein
MNAGWNDFDDDYGTETDDGLGFEDDGPDAGESYESDEEWLGMLMDEISEEMEGTVDLRRTSEIGMEGEVNDQLWMTVEFNLTPYSGPGVTEAVMTYTVEGGEEIENGQIEFQKDQSMTMARELAREELVDGIQLHPLGEDISL